MKERVERLRAKLEEAGLDALLVSTPENRRYLSGFTGSAGYLLITRDEAVIAVDFRYYEQAETQAPDFRLFRGTGPVSAWYQRLFEGLGGKTVGFEQHHLTYAGYKTLAKAVEELPEASRPKIVPAPPLVEDLRVIKDAGEIAAIQAAIDLGDAAITHVMERIQPGWTEKQVAWEIEKYIREHGGDGTSFPTIVAGGPWGALPHAYPRDVALEEGQGVVIDMGVTLNGYVSDLTRTIFLGEPDDQFKRIYDVVHVAQQTAAELIEAGMTGGQAHQLASRVIEQAGHGDRFGHGLGHGVGLQVHEAPRLAPNSQDELKDGMVFSIEPGIYIPGWGGVRIEDLAVLEHGKVRVLSRAPKLAFTGSYA
ncbi:MAG TPA: Xaa-Pro peptidase family protein [Dehalococcoidia bacterium]